MSSLQRWAVIASLLAALNAPVQATQVTISNVPAYNWYHGCGPTAAASILGYWDLNGLSNLFTAAGWDQISLTANVQDQISSPAHNAKFDPSPDDPNLPNPPDTSIADFFHTSENQAYGWSWLSDAPAAFTGYGAYRGYEIKAWNETYGSQFGWSDLVTEIDAGRPVMFLIDTDGNGGTDHFVPVIGYDNRGAAGLYYGSYTTWSEDETIAWSKFQGMGTPWGIGFATLVQPTQPRGVPDSGSALELCSILVMLWSGARFRKRVLDRRAHVLRQPPILVE